MNWPSRPDAGDRSSEASGCGWIIALILGLISLIGGILLTVSQVRLHVSGETLAATRTQSWDTTYKGRTTSHCYYEFSVGGKKYWSKSTQCSSSQAPVRYLPSDPETNELASKGESLPSGIVLVVVGLVSLGYGIFAFTRNDDLLSD